MNNEIELLIKLKHPDPYTNPKEYIESLPDEVASMLYEDKRDVYGNPWPLEHRREEASGYFVRRVALMDNDYEIKRATEYQFKVLNRSLRRYYESHNKDLSTAEV